MRRPRFRLKSSALIAASISLIFADNTGFANPTGAQVVNGAVSLARPDASTLNVTNSPGSIINWQGFSIGASEVTRFIQQSASSAVLNRVVGGNISQIQGQLLSNGRVFLINPSGIVVGPGAVIDTAGFVGSTLNMLDADFLAGKLKFQGDAGSGSIINQGWIRTGYGGQVILVAPQIENSGLIHTPGGELILAAGKSLTIASLDLDGVQFEVQAPTDSVLNVGKLLADGGAVGVFAGTLRHSGDIRANALVTDAAGRIVLKAQDELQAYSGSSITADGGKGGSVTLQSPAGLTRVAGHVSAQGSAGKGGDIRLLGDRVSVVENSVIDASGATGGGQVLVGGDFQGGNALIQNAVNTFVGAGAALRADATHTGDGGRIIVWSDDRAQFYGSLSAQGGPGGGNGGFAEVSGKQNLIFAGTANLGAPQGGLGTLLLDPLDLYAFTGGGMFAPMTDEATDFPGNAATIDPVTLAAIVGNVNLFASRYMRFNSPITLTTAGQGLTATVGTYTAPVLPDPLALNTGTVPNQMVIGANVTTNGGTVTLNAPTIVTSGAPTIATGGGAISVTANALQAGSLALNAGSGAVSAAATTSSLQLGAVTGGSFTATAPSSLQILGAITTAGGPVSLSSTGGGIFTSSIASGGGAVNLAAPSSVGTGTITSGGGSVSLAGSSVSTGTIDANNAGSVALNASAGGISSTVNNVPSLTATAVGGFSTNVSINSSTDINVASVSANCGGFTCLSSATLSTSTGSIRGTGSGNLVRAGDVSLLTGVGTGGGIGTTATALNVDVPRNFTFRPNGDFNVLLTGTGPVGLTAQLGVAPAAQTYSGTLVRQAGGLTLNASATDTTVTVGNLAVTNGFDQQVFGSGAPSITLSAPNGALVANSVTVPAGDSVSTIANPNGFALPVTLSASGDLTLNSYTRAAGGLPKSTSLSSSGGMVVLGAVDASKDGVTVSSSTGVTIGSLLSTGDITVSATTGAVRAQADSGGLEITSGGTLAITAPVIGAAGFANPLDVAATTISLTSQNATGGQIGFAGAPVIANTQNLTINAANAGSFNVATTAGATFNVSTGATSLSTLNVTANPLAVGDTGVAQVSTASGGSIYLFDADIAGNLAFTPPVSTGRNVDFRSIFGDITLGTTNLGTGNLVVTANSGSILGGSAITAANVALTAQQFSGANSNINVGNVAATGAGGSIALKGNTAVNTGNLDAAGSITLQQASCCSPPAIAVVNAIGATASPKTITIEGSSVNVGGAVTGDPAAADTITISSSSGASALTIGGAIAGGNGSTITLTNSGGPSFPFAFTKIDAGATGKVTINSSPGIAQTSGDAAGNGITAQEITLNAANTTVGDIHQTAGDTNLDLFGVKKLTIDSGRTARLDAQGSTLTDLKITKRTAPATGLFVLNNLGSSQAVSIIQSTNPFELGVSSPTAPLNFDLTSNTAPDVTLVGSSIATGGGFFKLATGGGINNATTGGMNTLGGLVFLNASGGAISTGAINTSTTGNGAGGGIEIINNAATGAVTVSGNLNTGTGGAAVSIAAFGGSDTSSVTRSGGAQITSDTSVTISTNFANIGTSTNSLVINTPRALLRAGGQASLAATTGHVYANVNSTTYLLLNTFNGFNVTSNTALNELDLTTAGGGNALALSLSAPGQTFSFSRPGLDAFGGAITNTFRVIAANGPAIGSFRASSGDLLVGGAGTSITVPTLNLYSSAAGDIKLQGTAANPLTLSNTTQNFGSTSSSLSRDLLIRGNVALSASSTQTLSASRDINVLAQDGTVSITAPTQTIQTGGGASKMEFLGGALAGETVTVAATDSQTFNASGSSTAVDSLKLKGGAGSGASVTVSHSGGGSQLIQVSGGAVTVEGGSGAGATVKLETTGPNQQKLCRDSPFSFCGAPIGALNILGGSGAGAFAQITASGPQFANVSGSTTVKGGTGDGAYALLQSGAGATQTINTGSLLVEGVGGAGAVGKAEILASGFQDINGGNMTVKAGPNAGSLARIATTGVQDISGSSLTVTAGGVDPTPVANASATVEGHSQAVNVSSLTLNGGSGTAGNTSDAVLRNLSGSQRVFASTLTMNGGHQHSTTGIINAGTGTQTVQASTILMRSDPVSVPAHADSFVLIQNQPATPQTITATGSGLTLSNSGDGTVAITSAGTQTVTSDAVAITTAATGSGNATLSATGSQWIRTTDQVQVAALGTGTASIESGASQLLEVNYPGVMQDSVSSAALTVGDVNVAGTSRIKAVDQAIFAGSLTVQSGAANSISEIKATGSPTSTQTITTLTGGISVLGGSGDNSLAQIDPVSQTIVANGDIDIIGGSGNNAIAQIVSGNTQTILSANGNVTLMGGAGSGADAFITTSGPFSSVGAFGDGSTTGNISLISGTASDAIISVGGGTGTVAFACSGSCALSSITPGPGPDAGVFGNPSPTPPAAFPGAPPPSSSPASSPVPPDSTNAILALQEDQNAARLDATPEEDEDRTTPPQRAPICN